MIDPRTKDRIVDIQADVALLHKRIEALEELCVGIYRLSRSSNEALVRRYGDGKKNTAQQVAKAVGDKLKA